ncbi:hypothetical protein FSARC_7146 [Fusarium sarcochroum]|uniref:CorA-like transporter domain-containing protein n=1 Tax=Fusarium sarcochroum TaxID=1208366 RepID=A0A8H4X7N2_9HYPO|nr:hypothetical protein FSARC_7146 [Fusarium sarcochroum]
MSSPLPLNHVSTTTSGKDEFDQSCDDFDSYPSNLCRSGHGKTARETANTIWERESKRTFNHKKSILKFVETCDCSKINVSASESVVSTSADQLTQNFCLCQPQLQAVDSLEKLKNHLDTNEADPRVRYVSIQSGSAKNPLNCSPAMFQYLCTYHQIPPSALNCVYSFRTILLSYDYCLAMFKDENTLLASQGHTLALDHLGRSGREIRYSFLLRSVENSSSVPGTSWGIRQLAVYHSFDVQSGQAFWMTCKGNSAIESSIYDAISNDSTFKPGALRSVPEAFSATFDILAMILDWCDENWRWYINEMVDKVMEKAGMVKTYKIADEPNFPDLKKRLTFGAQADDSKRPRSPSVDLECGIRLRNYIKAFSFSNKPTGQSRAYIEDAVDELEKLEVFSFKELQEFQELLERIQEALLVLKLNYQAIKQLRDHYQALMTQYRIPEMETIRSQCRNSFLQFSRRSRSVEGNIETRQAQLDSLHKLAQENKTLYESVLQYKSFQTDRIYADSAQSSAHNMEIIANKTKQETTSMHVITFVTLIFLPATFMAGLAELPGILEFIYPISKIRLYWVEERLITDL